MRQQIKTKLAWGLPVVLLIGVLVSGIAIADTSDPSWPGTEPIDISESNLNNALQPDISVDQSGQAFVAWSDQPNELEERNIYIAGSTEGAWSTPQAVTQTAKASRYPDVLSYQGQQSVVWVEGEPPEAIMETNLESGKSRTLSISGDATPAEWAGPQLAAANDRLHVLFTAGSGTISDLYHASRSLMGTWSEATLAYTSTARLGAWWPALATGPDGNTLHVVWESRESSEQSAITYISGTVDGAEVTWGFTRTLGEGNLLFPDLAVDPEGNVHVTWGEILTQTEQYIRYTRYSASSGSWITPAVRIDPEPVEVNPNIPLNTAPSIALHPTNDQVKVCVAWHGFRTGDPTSEEILLRCIPGGGQWAAAMTTNVSRSATQEGQEVSMRPAIAFDATGRLHAVWQEHIGEDLKKDYQTYYARALNQVFLPLMMKDG